MDPELCRVILEDMKTYFLISTNENYKTRLKEAYDYVKNLGDIEKAGKMIGAFTEGELTIFDRIQDESYKKFLQDALSTKERYQEAASNKQYGDQLASWGKLGETPFRKQMINNGDIVEGLKPEEQQRHFG